MFTKMTRLSRGAILAAGFLLTFQVVPAKASTIYNNGAAASDSTRCAEDSGQCDGTWTVFDDFVVSSASTVTDIFWTSTFYGGLSDFNGIRAWIYDADPVFGGGNLLHTIGTQGGNPSANGGFFDVQLTGLSINLLAGTYWLGMQHDTTSNYATVACISGGCGNTGTSTQWQNDGAGFRNADGKEYAFRLESVPDSGSALALLSFGLIAFSALRRQLS